MIASVQLKKKSGREFQGACSQDEQIGGKPPAVTLRIESRESLEMAVEGDSEEMARKNSRCSNQT
jgi:hypothetical protein